MFPRRLTHLLRAGLFAVLLSHCAEDAASETARPEPEGLANDGAGPTGDAARPVIAMDASALVDSGCDAGALESIPMQNDASLPIEEPWGPGLRDNPWAAGRGFATQHGDPGASDSSPLSGPGAAPVVGTQLDLFAACPSILPTRAGLLVAVCTQITNQMPAVYLLDPVAMKTLASRELKKGDLFGGVYPYLDHGDQLVAVDGQNDLLRIGIEAARSALTSVDTRPLGPTIAEHCGSNVCDSVVGLAPDYQDRVWFATASGLLGAVSDTGVVRSVALPEGERVANSIASAPEGVAVVTDHALYLLRVSADGQPMVVLRAPYDRGVARKPGQLSWGSGSTPTFFGPRTGSEYVAITDNARPTMNLLVFSTDGRSEPVCRLALPAPAGFGSENSPIGAGRSVFVTSTYGYPYAALPAGAGSSEPASAALSGGMVRVDVAADESGCSVGWTNDVRSAAVPKLSLPDGLLYTIERVLAFSNASVLDRYAYVAIDARSGEVLMRQELPGLPDTMQLAGTIATDRQIFQGTITGLTRLVPALP